MSSYNYTEADTLNNSVNIGDLQDEISHSTIVESVLNISQFGNSFTINFSNSLTPTDKTSLDTIVANHSGNALLAYEKIVKNAIGFFEQLMVQYAATNITLGITYYGKTKEVADYLATVMRYGQSGSLYEVINEIKVLRTSGWPSGIATYVNDSSMQSLLNKVEEYLGVTPLTDWS